MDDSRPLPAPPPAFRIEPLREDEIIPDAPPRPSPPVSVTIEPLGEDEEVPFWDERDSMVPIPSAVATSEPPDRPVRRPIGVFFRDLVYEMAETLLLTLLIFTIIQAFVQNYRIEGYSMEPSMHQGQRLFVDKFSYIASDPKRGDIIVLLFPKGDPNGPEEDYIKRIIGLPGDTVECQPGQIFVNGQLIEEPYINDPNRSPCAPMTLGPDQYFVMGDNRNASSDSRSWGALDRRYIIGKAWFIYYPFDQAGRVPNYPLPATIP